MFIFIIQCFLAPGLLLFAASSQLPACLVMSQGVTQHSSSLLYDKNAQRRDSLYIWNAQRRDSPYIENAQRKDTPYI